MDKQLLTKVLAEWLEERVLPDVISRDISVPEPRPTSGITAIVGPRRAGKTFFMYQIMQNWIARGAAKKEDILFVDFEDYRLSGFRSADFDDLLAAFVELTQHRPRFLFLDEIQHVPGWNRLLRTLHNQTTYTIVISGSNSNLLSEEISTELRGRYRDIVILPFSFHEWLRWHNIAYAPVQRHTATRGRWIAAFDRFIKEGGYPEVLRAGTAIEKRQILQTYYQTIFYKDIVERYRIKARATLQQMMTYCLNTYAELFSISAFEKVVKQSGSPASKRTISNYLTYLQEAFFLITHEKFSYSPKQRLMNPKKSYLLDTGFAALATDFTENRGKLLENVVAIELRRRRWESFYFKGHHECDFITKPIGRPGMAIQVTWDMGPRNEEREWKGLLEAMQTLRLKEGVILTHHQESTLLREGKRIRLIPVWAWCLEGHH